jgi:hypothetical protein
VRLRAALVAVALLTAACSSVVDGSPVADGSARPSTGVPTTASPTTPRPTSTASPGAPGEACPATYLAPDPDRPRVRLAFVVAPDLMTVKGTEHIEFTPDAPITELVFRLTANTAPTVAAGNKIEITSATADHGGGRFTVSPAGADPSTQGGLLHIPFAAHVSAGTTVTADLAFTLTLAGDEFDRFGSLESNGGHYAWFGSGQPLLAWERGFGWHDEDLLQFTAESATSEAMDTSLQVTAPSGYEVLMSGVPGERTSSGSSTVWTSHGDALRDVSVAVGPFKVTEQDVDGVKLRLGAYSQAERDKLVPEFERAIRELAKRFGPFPFPSLTVARPPSNGGGIEYPSSILMADSGRLVVVHETAHMYFYAMVGDSQALHPWLDEAFASMAEQLIDGTTEDPSALRAPGPVDAATESYGSDDATYYFTTYNKGAAALQAARNAAGPDKFDAALRCYVAANAWTIANPPDLEAALKQLPEAVKVLQQAGALD